jgi:hypothetical protein
MGYPADPHGPAIARIIRVPRQNRRGVPWFQALGLLGGPGDRPDTDPASAGTRSELPARRADDARRDAAPVAWASQPVAGARAELTAMRPSPDAPPRLWEDERLRTPRRRRHCGLR